MSHETFTVDTHLFRELGELLVGRDSTALIELIKNSYDADSTHVYVHGEQLEHPAHGKIIIQDDGIGMNASQFRNGFLRIASRLKDQHDRRSAIFRRRFTGAKGIGRLAAHKLAKKLRVYSVPSSRTAAGDDSPINATIDWQQIERQTTLDEIKSAKAVSVEQIPRPTRASQGTRIELGPLRGRWTSAERARFYTEVQTFSPPEQLIRLPERILPVFRERRRLLLFEEPQIKDVEGNDPGFTVSLKGDLEGGEEYWQSLAQTAQWILEIDATSKTGRIGINLVPTVLGLKELAEVKPRRVTLRHPTSKTGPFFHARILIREGSGGSREERQWMRRSSGIRVFMEGFRVPPYGEPNDDWLSLDFDYTRRQRSLPLLSQLEPLLVDSPESADRDEGLLFLGNSNYFGGVFLTANGSPTLQMLVNREGFIPSPEYDSLVSIVRLAIHVSVRFRAAASLKRRLARRQDRIANPKSDHTTVEASDNLDIKESFEATVERVTSLAKDSRRLAATGDIVQAQQKINEAVSAISEVVTIRSREMTEDIMIRVLASVGTQMAAFVHEINGLLGTASAVEAAVDRVLRDSDLSVSARKELSRIAIAVGDLRRTVERHASYLVDVVSADARRRRSRQKISQRFDSAVKIVQAAADRKGATIENDISGELRSPPMFPAELSVVFSNLLSNAVKAVQRNGRIRATGEVSSDGSVVVRLENTGRAVNPLKGERWFRPFESTTKEADPILGQGMGMGLTLTRNLLAEYGATISFVQPRNSFSTAIEIRFA